jgi:DNA-binding CsgD family transcriptional regulator/tetratricopeptide (TPR) repeat protein
VAQRVTASRFVGREGELAELERTLLGTVPEDLPAVYFIAGESGVGKTRLLRELIGKAEAGGARVLGGTSIELGEDELPYAPLVAMLRPLHRSCEPVLHELSEGTRAELARLNPEIGAPSAEPESERGEAQRRLFDAILELVSRLGEEGPVVLWIEDIHWADRSTRAFLRFLSASLDDERVLVAATYRSDELHRRHPLRPLLAELERMPRARRIELERFDRRELAQQLGDILGEVPLGDVVERLYGRSDGNPLFTEELVAAGVDGRGSLPPSLREALLLRVERLSPLSQRLLRVLAVAVQADQELLTEAEPAGIAEVSAAMHETIETQIVVTLESGRFAFRHALLREVLYDDLLPGERAELHLTLAGALERLRGGNDSAWLTTGIAHHYFASGDQPRALKAALEAADAVRSLHAYGEASALLDRAIELWARVPDPQLVTGIDEGELLGMAGRVHYLAGEEAIGAKLYERAIAATGEDADPERLADLLTALARCQWFMGQAERSRESQRRGLELLAEQADSPARARLLAQQVRFLLLQGRYREVCEAAPEALDAAERLGLDSEYSGILNRLGCALFALGREEEARKRLTEAIAVAERTDISDDLATAYLNFADSLHLAGNAEEAREIATRGVERVQGMTSARAGGSTRALRFIHLNLAEIHFDLGEWERADDDLRSAGDVIQGVAWAHANLRRAQIGLARGQIEGVSEMLEEAEEVLAGALEPQYIALQAALQAELATRQGDLERARAATARGLDRIQFCSEDSIRIALVAGAGLAVEAEIAVRARDLGEAEEEQAALDRARSLAAMVNAAAEEAPGRPVEAALSAVAQAELARASDEDDPALWSATADAWAQLDRPYPIAIARWRQAQASLGRADRDAAAVALAQAAEIAQRLGAGWLAGEAEGLAARARLSLRPTGEDEPEGHETPFGLTPRELQVLELVASGATNREIGERLFMAEKTASVHVSRILTKLDVRGRTEAAAVAHRHGISTEA